MGLFGYVVDREYLGIYLLTGSPVLKLLVFLACAGIFTNVLPHATLTQRKQSIVALVKKHPIASIMSVGTVWVVYKMIRNYRRTGSLVDGAPEWWVSLRTRYNRWKKLRSGEGGLPRQPEQAEDRRTPQYSRERSSEDPNPMRLERSRDLESGNLQSVEERREIFSPNAPIHNSVTNQTVVQVQDSRDRYSSDYVVLDVEDYKVRTFFEAAIKGKNPREQNTIGLGFLNGIGVEQDLAKAITLFEAAAKQEFSDAQYNLATCYLRGLGVRKNLSKSLSWFCKAAGNCNLDSQVLMYHILRKGVLVPQDATMAGNYFEWIKKRVGSEAAARKKLAESELYTEFAKSIVKKSSAGEQCSICREEVWPSVEQDASVSILPCRHCFCQSCLARWLEEQPTCPLCRAVVHRQEIIVGSVV